MRIGKIELRVVDLPLVQPFVTGFGSLTSRSAVVVRIETDLGEGWGDCGAMPTIGYSQESTETAFSFLQKNSGALLHEDLSPATMRQHFQDAAENPMACAALELAMLDAQARSQSISIANVFSQDARKTVPAGVVIGLAPIFELLQEVELRIGEGYQRLKIKIQPDHDVDVLRQIRHVAGDAIELCADANGAYGKDDFKVLQKLDEFNLSYIEQPLHEDFSVHAVLAQQLSTPLCLDESLPTIALAKRAIDVGACSVICIKAPRFGSWTETVAFMDQCHADNIPTWVGGLVETGIGRRANVALAAHPGATLCGDIGATGRFFAEDICAPLTLDGSVIAVNDQPGFGEPPTKEVLDRVTVRSEFIA